MDKDKDKEIIIVTDDELREMTDDELINFIFDDKKR